MTGAASPRALPSSPRNKLKPTFTSPNKRFRTFLCGDQEIVVTTPSIDNADSSSAAVSNVISKSEECDASEVQQPILSLFGDKAESKFALLRQEMPQFKLDSDLKVKIAATMRDMNLWSDDEDELLASRDESYYCSLSHTLSFEDDELDVVGDEERERNDSSVKSADAAESSKQSPGFRSRSVDADAASRVTVEENRSSVSPRARRLSSLAKPLIIRQKVVLVKPEQLSSANGVDITKQNRQMFMKQQQDLARKKTRDHIANHAVNILVKAKQRQERIKRSSQAAKLSKLSALRQMVLKRVAMARTTRIVSKAVEKAVQWQLREERREAKRNAKRLRARNSIVDFLHRQRVRFFMNLLRSAALAHIQRVRVQHELEEREFRMRAARRRVKEDACFKTWLQGQQHHHTFPYRPTEVEILQQQLRESSKQSIDASLPQYGKEFIRYGGHLTLSPRVIEGTAIASNNVRSLESVQEVSPCVQTGKLSLRILEKSSLLSPTRTLPQMLSPNPKSIVHPINGGKRSPMKKQLSAQLASPGKRGRSPQRSTGACSSSNENRLTPPPRKLEGHSKTPKHSLSPQRKMGVIVENASSGTESMDTRQLSQIEASIASPMRTRQDIALSPPTALNPAAHRLFFPDDGTDYAAVAMEQFSVPSAAGAPSPAASSVRSILHLKSPVIQRHDEGQLLSINLHAGGGVGAVTDTKSSAHRNASACNATEKNIAVDHNAYSRPDLAPFSTQINKIIDKTSLYKQRPQWEDIATVSDEYVGSVIGSKSAAYRALEKICGITAEDVARRQQELIKHPRKTTSTISTSFLHL